MSTRFWGPHTKWPGIPKFTPIPKLLFSSDLVPSPQINRQTDKAFESGYQLGQ